MMDSVATPTREGDPPCRSTSGTGPGRPPPRGGAPAMPFALGNRPRPAYHDRAFVRAQLAPWDERWQALGRAARQTFLRLKVARRPGTSPPRNPLSSLPVEPLEELA